MDGKILARYALQITSAFVDKQTKGTQMEEGKEPWWTLSTVCPATSACLDHPSWELSLLGSLLLPHPPVESCQWIHSSGISCPCSHVTALPICLASAALC